jgi:SAM-dependent methyltransferase
MVPIALKLGTGSETICAPGRVIVGGVTASVILTVYIVPAAYLIVYEGTGRISPPSRTLQTKSCLAFVYNRCLEDDLAMQPAQASVDQIKQRMRGAWTAGDFGQIARYTTKCAEDFVDRLQIQPGARVLDVACGTGNLAIPAARKGAQVWGIDIAPNLLEQARQRAAAEGLQAAFDEGDAEQLPYPDAHFDVVMSMFGAMFGPRPELVAAELARVCRPKGTIAMANWTPDGFVAKQFAVGNRYVPPPEGIPAPVLWGEERVVRQRLGAYASEIRTTPQSVAFGFPFPPREVVEFFRQYFGPTQVAFSMLPADAQTAYMADLESLWREKNEASDGRTAVRAEYLEVIATRA